MATLTRARVVDSTVAALVQKSTPTQSTTSINPPVKKLQSPVKYSAMDVVVNLTQHVEAFLKASTAPGQTLLLAFSGGIDSCVLLDILVFARDALAKQSLDINLQAMHVHHGLSPNADAWAEFCTSICARHHIPLHIVHVAIPSDSGLGIEAAARQARYAALLDYPSDYVLLAHHEDDQAETLLLQLLRGAGVKGLSAMAQCDDGRRLLRPLLNVSHAELAAYAKKRKLQWIDDESNQDTRFDRNFCRHYVIPVLEQRFPAAKATLARSAGHIAEAAALLDELAQLDAAHCVQDQHLNIESLAKLSMARARNLLRWWLSSHQQALPSTQRLQEMLSQLLGAKSDAMIKVAIDSARGVWLRRYKNLAYIELNKPDTTLAMVWQGEAELYLPDQSRLLFDKQIGAGLAIERLGINKLRISSRIGGERFKPDVAKPTRTLKHLLQEANIPPWQRERLPLVYCDDTLAVVPNIGVASHLQANERELGLVISWICE